MYLCRETQPRVGWSIPRPGGRQPSLDLLLSRPGCRQRGARRRAAVTRTPGSPVFTSAPRQRQVVLLPRVKVEPGPHCCEGWKSLNVQPGFAVRSRFSCADTQT